MQIHTTIQQANMFQIMFEELPVAIALTNNSGQILYTNKEFSQITGSGPERLKSQLIDDILKNTATDADGILNKKQQILTEEYVLTGKSNLEINNRFLQAGETEYSLKLMVNKVGQYFCFTVKNCEAVGSAPTQPIVLTGITKDKKLSEKLELLSELNRELKRSNQDLSQYAYVASHDLQEPLRKIRIYGDMLNTSDKIGSKEKFLVAKINAASQRMSILITDLLNYSRLLKPDDEKETVDLQEILLNVMTDFEVSIQERKAVIKLSQLPVIHAVKLQMNQLFFNLLGNALKFTIPGEPPRVEISTKKISAHEAGKYVKEADEMKSYVQISFTDHGIGFNTNQAEEIFEVFKRLYTRDTYQGSGIGLALCRRIVLNHDGALFATSTLGKGAVFNIVLPASN